MLFEAAGIADILMQANRLSPAGAPLYQIAVATTQSHRVIHGLSGLSLLADHRPADLDPALPRDTVIVAGKGRPKQRAPRWRIGCAARPAGAPYRFRLRRGSAAGRGRIAGRTAGDHPLAAGGNAAGALPAGTGREWPDLRAGWADLDLRRRQFRLRPDVGAGGGRLWLRAGARSGAGSGDVSASPRRAGAVQPLPAQPRPNRRARSAICSPDPGKPR